MLRVPEHIANGCKTRTEVCLFFHLIDLLRIQADKKKCLNQVDSRKGGSFEAMAENYAPFALFYTSC